VVALFAVEKGGVCGVSRSWAGVVAGFVVNQVVEGGRGAIPVSLLDCSVVEFACWTCRVLEIEIGDVVEVV